MDLHVTYKVAHIRAHIFAHKNNAMYQFWAFVIVGSIWNIISYQHFMALAHTTNRHQMSLKPEINCGGLFLCGTAAYYCCCFLLLLFYDWTADIWSIAVMPTDCFHSFIDSLIGVRFIYTLFTHAHRASTIPSTLMGQVSFVRMLDAIDENKTKKNIIRGGALEKIKWNFIHFHQCREVALR